jgi:hypothetical protein
MINQKCQPRPSQKINDPVTMDKFKTYPKWLKGFFMLVQNGSFLTKFYCQKN